MIRGTMEGLRSTGAPGSNPHHRHHPGNTDPTPPCLNPHFSYSSHPTPPLSYSPHTPLPSDTPLPHPPYTTRFLHPHLTTFSGRLHQLPLVSNPTNLLSSNPPIFPHPHPTPTTPTSSPTTAHPTTFPQVPLPGLVTPHTGTNIRTS